MTASAEEMSVQSTAAGWSFQLTGDQVFEPWLIQYGPNLTDWEDLIFFDTRRPGATLTTASVNRFELKDAHAPKGFFQAIQLTREQATARMPYADGLRRWYLNGPPRYRFTIDENAGSVSWTATMEVHDGVIQSAAFSNVYPPIISPSPITISGLFERVGQALRSNAEIVTVIWDKDAGYPVTGFIDISSELADEERSWTITNFEALLTTAE